MSVNPYVFANDTLDRWERIEPHAGPPLFIIVDPDGGKAVARVRAWVWTAPDKDGDIDFGPVALVDGGWLPMDEDVPALFDSFDEAMGSLPT